MPIYCFANPHNEDYVEREFSMAEAPDHIMVDGVRWERDFFMEMQGSKKMAGWPVYSNALGMSDPGAQQQYRQYAASKGVNDVEFDKRGRMVMRTKAHRRQLCEVFGYTDFDGGYGDPHSD